MEIIELLKFVLRYKWMLLVMCIISLLISVGVTQVLPKTYRSDVVYQVNQKENASLLAGGSANSGDPYEQYGKIVDDSGFNKLVLNQLAKDTANKEHLVHTDAFNIGLGYQPKQSLLTLYAEASSPALAKKIVDTASIKFLEQVVLQENKQYRAKREMLLKKIEEINGELRYCRGELEIAQEKIKSATGKQKVELSVYIASKEDTVDSYQILKRAYYDAYTKLEINNTLSRDDLSLVSGSSLPSNYEKPSLIINAVLSCVIALLLGCLYVLVIQKDSSKASSREVAKRDVVGR